MTPPATTTAAVLPGRLVAAGKWFRAGETKVTLRAVSYGPFRPGAETAARLEADFASISAMGFNAVRVYELPSEAMLAAAVRHGLRLIVGIPWTQHVDFLSHASLRTEIEATIRDAARRCGQHEAVAALIIGNEIDKTLVRWMEPLRVKRFIESLVRIAKEEAPQCLVSYATYPSTEYLIADNADFLAVNVYLEQREAFEKYLLRLQHLAGNKPLMISEFGLDMAAHGEAKQAETRTWFEEACAHHGVAGSVWFAFTDEWHRGGEDVTQWQFGLVDTDRKARPAARMPAPALVQGGPRISVVVCTRNGSATLRACLEALSRQTYPNHEVIVVDDGSTDAVPEIAKSFAFVRYHRLNHGGLSVARNAGALLATGDVIAYTDDDCMADEDWLAQLAPAFDDPQWVAAGGPNIPPPARNRIEAVVAVAPGGPAHVMLNDEEAEHLPGCNLAIRKSALDAIGGFDPIFHTAGDDVDVCWRLRDAGGKLRFVPSAMVWHHRRFTVKAYFKQQRGYGNAEGLLMRQHPQRFGSFGGARWRGAIYGDAPEPREGSIFHGSFGAGAFQVIYANGDFAWWHWLSGVLWIAFAALFLVLRLPAVSLAWVVAAVWVAWRRTKRSTAMSLKAEDAATLWFLCLAQPVVRELGRFERWPDKKTRAQTHRELPAILPPQRPRKWSWRIMGSAFWSETGIGREQWLAAFRAVLQEQGIPFREDDGWRWFDIELNPTRWISHSIVTVTEYHGGNQMLTRVGVQRRVRRMLFAIIAALMIASVSLPLPNLWLRLCCAVPCQLLAVWIAAGWLFSESYFKRLIQAAADRAELQPIDQRLHPTRSESRLNQSSV